MKLERNYVINEKGETVPDGFTFAAPCGCQGWYYPQFASFPEIANTPGISRGDILCRKIALTNVCKTHADKWEEGWAGGDSLLIEREIGLPQALGRYLREHHLLPPLTEDGGVG
jgi:hypothetical protein